MNRTKTNLSNFVSDPILRNFTVGVFYLFISIAQVHAEHLDNYYEPTKGKTGMELKNVLHEIISNSHHTCLPYTKESNQDWYDQIDTDVWEALVNTDTACPESSPNCGKVQLLYSDEVREIYLRYSGGKWKCRLNWEREHVWPGSRGLTDYRTKRKRIGYTDLHHIRPADKFINWKHDNYSYNKGGENLIEKCESPSFLRETDAKFNKDGNYFEPPDRAKGQVARMLFYMAVRYEGDKQKISNCDAMPDLILKDENEAQKIKREDEETWMGNLCTLLEWNRKFKPTMFEKRRNDRVHKLQGNRNPFIDHHTWADEIWIQDDQTEECRLASS